MDTPDSPDGQTTKDKKVDQQSQADQNQSGEGQSGGAGAENGGGSGPADDVAKAEAEKKREDEAAADREKRIAEDQEREKQALQQSYDLVGSHQIDPGLALRAVVFMMLRHGMPVEAFQEAVLKVSAFEPAAEEPA